MIDEQKTSADEAVDHIIKSLKRIPEKIESKILIDEISKAIYDKLRRKISV